MTIEKQPTARPEPPAFGLKDGAAQPRRQISLSFKDCTTLSVYVDVPDAVGVGAGAGGVAAGAAGTDAAGGSGGGPRGASALQDDSYPASVEGGARAHKRHSLICAGRADHSWISHAVRAQWAWRPLTD